MAKRFSSLPEEKRRQIVRDTVARVYGIDQAVRPGSAVWLGQEG